MRGPGARSVRAVIWLGSLAVLWFWWAGTSPSMGSTPATAITAFGELAGLIASYLVCAQVLLVARVPWFERAVGLDRLVSDILSAHLAQMSVRQNDDMRKISAWAAMAAIPTMVAGIYGMNFEHMPELRWVWSYPAVIALTAGLEVLVYRLFKRRGWL